MMDNYFAELNQINVSGKTEKKGSLTYLSWVWAWGELKKRHPDAIYTIYENEHGWPYFTDGRTAWVKTGVTVSGIEHIEYLPIMDFKNRSIPVENITSYEVNKTIQRSLTKAIARHGLGLYIYAGEDLPEGEEPPQQPQQEQPQQEQPQQEQPQQSQPARRPIICEQCGQAIRDAKKRNGEIWPAEEIAGYTKIKYGKSVCVDCGKALAKENENS